MLPQKRKEVEFITQIIYPRDIFDNIHQHGYLIGWNLRNFRCFISGIVVCHQNEYENINNALRKTTNKLNYILQNCSNYSNSSTPPIILGSVMFNVKNNYVPTNFHQNENIWITISINNSVTNYSNDSNSNYINSCGSTGGDYSRYRVLTGSCIGYGNSYSNSYGNSIDQKKIQLHSIYSLGCLYETSCCFLQYDPIDSSQLQSLRQESKAIEANSYNIIPHKLAPKKTISSTSIIGNAVSSSVVSNSSELAASVSTNNSTILDPDTTDSTEMDFLIAQINASFDLQAELMTQLKINDEPTNTPKPSTSYSILSNTCIGIEYVLMLTAWLWCTWLRILKTFLDKKYSLFSLSPGFAYWLGLRGYGGMETPDGSSRGIACTDVSLAAVVVSERLAIWLVSFRECAFFPLSWQLQPSLKKSIWIKINSFYCLVLVDIILGIIIGLFLLSNCDSILNTIENSSVNIQNYVVLDSLKWFNHSPGGVKLNPQVTKKLGTILTFIIKLYSNFILHSKFLHSPLLKLIACSGSMGLTVQISLAIDAIRLFTLHISIIHRALSLQHHYQLQLIYTCWLLFQGKKKNILRKRVDHCDYDQQQLLFGIILFAVLIFFFPTFFAYFCLFTISQLVIVFIQYALWIALIALKEFPYYSIVLYIFYPYSLADDIQFYGSIEKTENNYEQKITYQPVADNSWEMRSSCFANSKDSGTKTTSRKVTYSANRDRSPMDTSSESIFGNGSVANVKSILKPSLNANKSVSERKQVDLTLSERRDSNSSRVQFRTNLEDCETDPLLSNNLDGDKGVGGTILDQESSPLYVASSPTLLKGSLKRYDPSKLGNFEEIIQNDHENNSKKMKRIDRTLKLYTSADNLRTMNNNLSRRKDAIFLSFHTTLSSLDSIFSGYTNYLRYIHHEEGLLSRLFRGIFFGRPSLDIQLIYATAQLSSRKNNYEQMILSHAANRLIKSRSDLTGKPAELMSWSHWEIICLAAEQRRLMADESAKADNVNIVTRSKRKYTNRLFLILLFVSLVCFIMAAVGVISFILSLTADVSLFREHTAEPIDKVIGEASVVRLLKMETLNEWFDIYAINTRGCYEVSKEYLSNAVVMMISTCVDAWQSNDFNTNDNLSQSQRKGNLTN